MAIVPLCFFFGGQITQEDIRKTHGGSSGSRGYYSGAFARSVVSACSTCCLVKHPSFLLKLQCFKTVDLLCSNMHVKCSCLLHEPFAVALFVASTEEADVTLSITFAQCTFEFFTFLFLVNACVVRISAVVTFSLCFRL